MHKNGQTLIEVIIVISVVILLVTGLVSGTTTSLKSAQTGRARLQATKYAEEGLEFARNIRDRSWSEFSALNGKYCLGSGVSPSLEATATDTCVNTISTSNTLYTRILTFSLSGLRMSVQSNVSFSENATIKNISLTTYLTQWK